MRYKITLSYNGADFCGWQIQPSAPSVQETLEKALTILLKNGTRVTGAGRTDSGVNAAGYVAHFDTAGEIDCTQIRCKLNAILPPSIAVSGISAVKDGFHARFDATNRKYTYFLHRVKDPFADNFSYFYGYPGLDVDAMNRAAGTLLGTHDFSSFEKSGGDNKTSICTISRAAWSPYEPLMRCHPDGPEPQYLRFDVEADRFLRNMVRAIVGTLLEVGRGRRSPESVAGLLEAKDRCAAGESVPGHALFLSGIEY